MAPPSQDSLSSGNYFDPTFLQEKLNSIQRLESDLETARGQDPQVRIRLCELYSECLLRNPAFSLEHNVLDRLWRNCFYQRIGEERKEISRRKRKNPGSVPQALNSFHRFLQEAIDLYGYLVKFYVSLVAPLDASVEGSQSYDLSQDDLDERGKEAVVAILHRFEIYLGDLNRYREMFQQAAGHYERAAMLAPGQGNPYNQLAVLEQLKDSSCNALYWYARSIRASTKPFETSLSNVERLYQSNRKWLIDNPEGSVVTPAKKAGADLARARKSAASKRFAASFVDLQQRLRDMANPDVIGQAARKTIVENMDYVISNLESFLSNNGLSDTLLCRMVVINAFTVSQFDVPMTKVLVWRFGTALAQRVLHAISKMVEVVPENPSSIRGVSPLLLTCDYVSHFESCSDECADAETVFWTKICELANNVKNLTHAFRLKDADIRGKLPREYGDLIGFTPFETFIDKPQQFLSIEDAKEILPLLQDVASSSSKKQVAESAGNLLDNRIKLAHFLTIVDGSPKVTNDMDGTYLFAGEQGEVECDPDDSDDGAPVDFDEPSMEAQIAPEPDMLLYKAPEHGGGPALLVPGALLLSMAATDTPKDADPIVELSTDPIDEDNIIAGTDRISLAPVAQVIPLAGDPEFPTQLDVAPAVSNVTPSTTSFPPLAPHPGLRAPPGLPPPPGFAPRTENNATTYPPAWDFLSRQPTSNPFMQPVTEYYSSTTSQTHVDPNDYLDHDETMGFLDSSLLQSLWCDDANQPLSKNPFLTGAK
ncbi:Telomerase activating protein Est1 [Fragilaria crotonensis]|nr:Telomerase activating protein Est1 [Fragilaria crotonensis]